MTRVVNDDPRFQIYNLITDEHNLVRSGHRLTIREMVDELILSFNATRLILTDDLNMRRMNMRFIPKLL